MSETLMNMSNPYAAVSGAPEPLDCHCRACPFASRMLPEIR